MKKRFAVSVCLIALAVLTVMSLAACGSKEVPGAGTYTGDYYKFVGDPDSAKVTTEPFSIELDKDGTGKFNRDGQTYNVEWRLDGEKLYLTERFLALKIEYTGVLSGTELKIYNGDPMNEFTCMYVFHKD